MKLTGTGSSFKAFKRIAQCMASSPEMLAAALGVILLGLILVLYIIYDKVVGIDNMKLG